jgi:hypothetical protein
MHCYFSRDIKSKLLSPKQLLLLLLLLLLIFFFKILLHQLCSNKFHIIINAINIIICILNIITFIVIEC